MAMILVRHGRNTHQLSSDLIRHKKRRGTFSSAPTAVSSSAVTMTATVRTDLTPTVEYLFTELSGNAGGTSSDWQESPVYVDDGLSASTTYIYTVTVRDGDGMLCGISDPFQVTTEINP